MLSAPRHTVTQLLADWNRGDQAALDQLVPLMYRELRQLARHYLARERADHTLQATALVHEAYLRLVDQTKVDWHDRTHFFAVAARVMRHVLVDHARRYRCEKRGGARDKVPLADAENLANTQGLDLVALDDALTRLAAIHPQMSRLVELRFFGGLTVDETAHVLGTSPQTVKRRWRMARAWLYREISTDPSAAC